MKNTMRFIILATMTTSVFAEQNQQQNNNGNNRQQANSYAATCETADQASFSNFLKDPKNAGQSPVKLVPTSTCDYHRVLAKLNGQDFNMPTDSKVTADNLIQCRKDGGYTVDYAICARMANLYDAVIVAEKLMMTAQSVKVSESNIAANKEMAKRTAEGDAQNAAIDATIARNEMNAKLYKTQAITYGGAVAALSSQLPSWLLLKKNLPKKCTAAVQIEPFKEPVTVDTCKKAVAAITESSVVFLNNDAKAKFMTAIGAFVKKAADAAKQAGVSEEVAAKLKNVVTAEDDTDVTLDACFVNPDSADCKATTGRGTTTTGTFKGNTVDFGASAGQTFDFTGSDGTIGSDDPNAVTDGTEKVTDVSSPFEDAAKAAKGILNPASAAQIGPGSAGAGAAGGGGGGGGGGGHASLGNDLTGAAADSNKDPDINTNKLSGKYKEGKAAGFQAVKGGSDEPNPFASMFDAKGEAGGIEEDRSIASDISGDASGLFEKISKKYGQVQQEKRVESQNLE